MTDRSDLPPGAFRPSHGRGWLKPAKLFEKGNRARLGKRNLTKRRAPRPQQAAFALRALFPALAEAIRTPGPTYRSWWRKRQATLLTSLSQPAAHRVLLGLMLLRQFDVPKPVTDETCTHCGLRLQGDALPVAVAPLVLGWACPGCLAPAVRKLVDAARQHLAKALER